MSPGSEPAANAAAEAEPDPVDPTATRAPLDAARARQMAPHADRDVRADPESELTSEWVGGPESGYLKQGLSRDGKKEGVWRMYDSEGRVLMECSYEAGRLHGTMTMWRPEGFKAQESQYVDGRLDGVVRGWHSNGNEAFRQTYRDGVLEGEAFEWFPDGSLQSQGSNHDGLASGNWLCYSSPGVLDAARSGHYERGARVGDSQ